MHDLRAMLRWSAGRADSPTAVILDSRTLQSTPGERRTGPATTGTRSARAARSTPAVDTLGAPAGAARHPGQRAGPGAGRRRWPQAVQEVTGQTVELAFVDQGYTGERARGRRRRARHPLGGRQAARGQARLRAAAPALGRRALLRLGGALPPPGQRLRTVAGNGGGPAFRRLRLPDAPSIAHRRRAKSITRSRYQAVLCGRPDRGGPAFKVQNSVLSPA